MNSELELQDKELKDLIDDFDKKAVRFGEAKIDEMNPFRMGEFMKDYNRSREALIKYLKGFEVEYKQESIIDQEHFRKLYLESKNGRTNLSDEERAFIEAGERYQEEQEEKERLQDDPQYKLLCDTIHEKVVEPLIESSGIQEIPRFFVMKYCDKWHIVCTRSEDFEDMETRIIGSFQYYEFADYYAKLLDGFVVYDEDTDEEIAAFFNEKDATEYSEYLEGRGRENPRESKR